MDSRKKNNAERRRVLSKMAIKSFNKFSRVCPHHAMRDVTHECYCKLIDETCNLTNCPRYKKRKV